MATKTPLPTTADEIRAAALRLLERGGPGAVTMRRVAAAVEITPMAIYHYFPNRAALLVAVTEGEFERLAACFRAATGEAGDVLIQAVAGYLDYALERPLVFDFVFGEKRKGARRYPADFRAGKSPTFAIVADELAARMKAGRMRRDDIHEAAFGIWALIHGLAVLYRAGRVDLPEKEFRALCERSVRRMINGLEN